jgi:hypothetical protein
MLDQEQVSEKQKQDRAKVAKVESNHAALIGAHDDKARELLRDLAKVYADLVALEELDKQAEKQDRETHLLIDGLFSIKVLGIPNIKGQIKTARQLVISQNGLDSLKAAGVLVEAW